MQFTAAIVTLFATVVTAQNLTGLPDCSQPCFVNAFPVSGCVDVSNSTCLCASTPFQRSVAACSSTACSQADQAAAFMWAEHMCNATGVALGPST